MGKFTTLLGILIALGLIVWSILSGGDPGAYIDIPSVAVVVGGTIGTTLMVFSLSKLKSLVKIFKIAFLKSDADKVEELYQILHLSNLSRKNGGILGIVSEIEQIEEIERFIDREYYEVLPQFVIENPANVLSEITMDLN